MADEWTGGCHRGFRHRDHARRPSRRAFHSRVRLRLARRRCQRLAGSLRRRARRVIIAIVVYPEQIVADSDESEKDGLRPIGDALD